MVGLAEGKVGTLIQMSADISAVVDDIEAIRGRVLVVDDQEAVARTVAKWLERDGFECATAQSALEAKQRVDAEPFDLVLSDVHMPGRSGLELARDLKAKDPSIQVVIMTGSTTLETAIEALRINADDYLVKPFEQAALLHATRRAVVHRRLLVENREYRRTLESRVREQAERLEGLYLSSIHSLVTALEAKDPHTRGHSDRVARYSLAILDCIGGMDPEKLRIGAQLHDIGKIGISEAVLRKEGPLDPDEVAQMQEHPTIGVGILEPLLDDETALAVVRHHHERWDGRGYPDGLAGSAISLGARIAAVADTFDAMTSSRPYRAAKSSEEAIAEIERESGRQFDPDIARHAAEALAGRAEAVG
jgi:putative two-component system response regulator